MPWDQDKLIKDSIEHGFHFFRDDNLGGNIIELSHDDYKVLLEDGFLPYNENDFKEKNSSGNLREGHSYIYLEDPEHYLYDYDPIESIIPFLKNSILGYYIDQKVSKLVLGLDGNIYDSLPGWVSDGIINKLPYLESLNKSSFKTDIPSPLKSQILQFRNFKRPYWGMWSKRRCF